MHSISLGDGKQRDTNRKCVEGNGRFDCTDEGESGGRHQQPTKGQHSPHLPHSLPQLTVKAQHCPPYYVSSPHPLLPHSSTLPCSLPAFFPGGAAGLDTGSTALPPILLLPPPLPPPPSLSLPPSLPPTLPLSFLFLSESLPFPCLLPSLSFPLCLSPPYFPPSLSCRCYVRGRHWHRGEG